jgi:NADH:ubiquinone reductase (H+-translocating)
MSLNIEQTNQKRIVILGGGFGGVQVAKRLMNKKVQVVLIDKHNYHTFQPLLYQVATGGLEPDSIAYPLRRIFQKAHNIHFRMAEALHVNIAARTLETNIGSISYDILVLATGSTTNFYNFGDSSRLMMPLKTIPESLDLRSFLLQNFEEALLTNDIREREGLINVAIAGGGPTGVELAGALGEMKKYILPRDYPEIDFRKMQIHLFEASPRLLAALSEESSIRAQRYLEKLGIQIWLNSGVDKYDGTKVTLRTGKILQAETLIWTAGVMIRAIEGIPAEAIVQGGRVKVDEYNRVISCEDIYAIGDMAAMISDELPKGHPMLAPFAISQGKNVARNIIRSVDMKSPVKYRFHNIGTMATVGKNRAVVELSRLRIYGTLAWYIWMFVHIMSLVGFRNRVAVFVNWFYNYFTYDRALRLIIRPFERKQ